MYLEWFNPELVCLQFYIKNSILLLERLNPFMQLLPADRAGGLEPNPIKAPGIAFAGRICHTGQFISEIFQLC